MNPETLRLTLQIVGLVLTCLNGLAVIAVAFMYFTGDNKAKIGKPEDGNGLKTGATVLLVVVLVVNVVGFAAFGGSFLIPTTPPDATQPAPDQTETDQQPPAQDFSSFCNPAMPTGKTFTAPEGGTRLPNGAEITQGKAYMYRVVNWSSDCKSAQVYLLFTMAAPSYGTAGPNFDGSPNHDQQTWLFEGDHLDNLMPKAMCELARDTLSGALGKDTNVVVHYSNQTDGRYTDVPEACLP